MKPFIVIQTTILLILLTSCNTPRECPEKEPAFITQEYYKGTIYLPPTGYGLTGIIKIFDITDPLEIINEFIPAILFQTDADTLEKGDTVYFKISKIDDSEYIAKNITEIRPDDLGEIVNFGYTTINLHGMSDHGGGSHKAGHVWRAKSELASEEQAIKTTKDGIEYNLYVYSEEENGSPIDTFWYHGEELNPKLEYFLGEKSETTFGTRETTKNYSIISLTLHKH